MYHFANQNQVKELNQWCLDILHEMQDEVQDYFTFDESVKIVIADDSEDRITHNIFYTAITRTTKHLTIYWSPEVCNRVLGQLKQESSNKDYFLFKLKHQL